MGGIVGSVSGGALLDGVGCCGVGAGIGVGGGCLCPCRGGGDSGRRAQCSVGVDAGGGSGGALLVVGGGHRDDISSGDGYDNESKCDNQPERDEIVTMALGG